MLKLTKQDRLEAYQKALILLEKDAIYLCEALSDVFGFENFDKIKIEKDFPELWKQKPEDYSYSWWSPNEQGRLNRINALNEAIKLCHDKD